VRRFNHTGSGSFEEFKSVLNDKGGFVSAHWEQQRLKKIKDLTKRLLDVSLWMV
jgi:prolyl-tRNA synthetase